MIKVKTDNDIISVKDMRVGQIGIIVKSSTGDTTYNNTIVLRVFDKRLIALNGNDTWNKCGETGFYISLLPNGTLLEITNNEG